jgi:hypothetical protein
MNGSVILSGGWYDTASAAGGPVIDLIIYSRLWSAARP